MSPFRLPLLGICLSLMLTPALAEEARSFDIPAQPLSSAINSLSQQSGLHVFYPDSAVQGRESAAVNGTYTPKQALSQMLSGSGVQAVSTAGDTVALKATAPAFIKTAADTSGGETTLPKVTVEANSQAYDPAWEHDTRNPSYNRTHSTTATKTDTPIMDTPISIQVVPKKILDDQQAYDIKEALKNVSGVQQSTSPSDYVNLVIRGFDANGLVYKNGIRQDSFSEETANLERIEVLKGPAAMLYGRIEPGGLVNLQTAQPLDQPYYSLQQQFGSYDFYRTTLDATGPITKDKSLLYRLNFAYRDNESYRDLSFKQRVFLAPTLTWNISDRTQANLLYEYQNDDYRADYGFPAVGNRPAQLPINRSLSDPAAHDVQESHRIFANWSHAFNDDWKLTHRFMAGFTDYEQFDLFTLPPEPNQTIYDRRLWRCPSRPRHLCNQYGFDRAF
jgi:iron complex outermembrane recepter protein